jgi:hypothetical protein
MAKEAQPGKASFMERLRQIGTVISFTAQRDKLFIPLAVLAALVPLAVVAVLVVLGFGWIWIPVGVLGAVLAFTIVLSLRSNRAMMREAEGQLGAAASIVQSMRGDWRVKPAISSTTSFDMVHLVLGRPGIILLAEGEPSRLRGLLSQERRRLAKVIGNAPMRDYTIGNGEGQLPLSKLRSTLMRIPPAISAKEVNALDTRLKALTARPAMPKGAIPKNMRPPGKANFRATRGR